MDASILVTASTWVVPALLAITLHEAAHGFVAERFGDDTARSRGRVTLNPFKHVDRVGTIILPALLLLTHSPVLFGYAKPVPVDFGRLQPLRAGMVAVALAGPVMNALLAILSTLLFYIPPHLSSQAANWLSLNLAHSIGINCMLAVFNMIPLLPLDGGRVLRALLPGRIGNAYARTERYGLFAVLLLLLLPSWLGIHIVMDALAAVADGLITVILFVCGNPIQ